MRIGKVRTRNGLDQRIVHANCRGRFGDPGQLWFDIDHSRHLLSFSDGNIRGTRFKCPGLDPGLFFVVEVGRNGLLMRIGEVRAANRLGQGIIKADGRSCFGNSVDFRFCIGHDCHLLSVVVFLGREFLPPREANARFHGSAKD